MRVTGVLLYTDCVRLIAGARSVRHVLSYIGGSHVHELCSWGLLANDDYCLPQIIFSKFTFKPMSNNYTPFYWPFVYLDINKAYREDSDKRRMFRLTFITLHHTFSNFGITMITTGFGEFLPIYLIVCYLNPLTYRYLQWAIHLASRNEQNLI